MTTPTMTPRLITVEQAIGLLDQNNDWNRSIRDATVRRYRRLMLTGGEKGFRRLSPAPIVIYRDPAGIESDQVLDGQRRLSAQVLANVPMEYYVYYTVDKNLASVCIDQGDPRTPTDQLKMLKLPRAELVAGTLRLLYQFDNDPYWMVGNRGDGRLPTDSATAPKAPRGLNPAWVELQEILDRDTDRLLRSVENGAVLWRKIPLRQLPKAALCALNYQFDVADAVGAQYFWALVSSPSSAARGTGPYFLNQYLDNKFQARERVKSRAGVALTRKAWWNHRHPEESMERLRFAATDSFPGVAG